MVRLNLERQERLEPKRMKFCLEKLSELGLKPKSVSSNEINFRFRGQNCKLFPYSGWWSCKGLGSGRGFYSLIGKIQGLLDKNQNFGYTKEMQTISIRAPRYRDRVVLLARYRLPCGQDVSVEIQHGAYKGRYLARNSVICGSKIEHMATRNGSSISMRAVPIDKMERIG